jgi:hypothetical protein
MIDTPVFTKRKPRPCDYQEMTWGKFIKLREWAKTASQEIGYPIYLVGSTLEKETPRDFDMVITIPPKEFEEKFGEVTADNWAKLLVESYKHYIKHYFECIETLGGFGQVPLDSKVYPDNWFTNHDKLLLAEPLN